jgi:hypothetical protein
MLPEMISWRWLEYLGFAAAGDVVVLLLCTGVADLLFLRRSVRDGRPWTRRKASRAFAEAVARGEFEAADAIAGLLLSPTRRARDRNDVAISLEPRRLIQGSDLET